MVREAAVGVVVPAQHEAAVGVGVVRLREVEGLDAPAADVVHHGHGVVDAVEARDGDAALAGDLPDAEVGQGARAGVVDREVGLEGLGRPLQPEEERELVHLVGTLGDAVRLDQEDLGDPRGLVEHDEADDVLAGLVHQAGDGVAHAQQGFLEGARAHVVERALERLVAREEDPDDRDDDDHGAGDEEELEAVDLGRVVEHDRRREREPDGDQEADAGLADLTLVHGFGQTELGNLRDFRKV